LAVINSINNFKVLQWIKLKNKINRDKQRLFLVEGFHLVDEANKSNYLKEIITLEKNTPFSVPSHQVTYDVMEKLSSMATPAKIMGICRQKEKTTHGNNILLIDQIHHPGNLGTIIRSAVAFDVDTLVLNNSVDIYNNKVIQATQGMIFHLNIIKAPLADFITQIKSEKYQIIGTDVKSGVPVNAVNPGKKRALIIGNEGDGVNSNLLDLCDIKINIKMNSKCESLNVGVAASIILYGLACGDTI